MNSGETKRSRRRLQFLEPENVSRAPPGFRASGLLENFFLAPRLLITKTRIARRAAPVYRSRKLSGEAQKRGKKMLVHRVGQPIEARSTMKLTKVLVLAALLMFTARWRASALPTLFEVAVDIDGTISDTLSGDAVPNGINAATGLGTASFTINGSGAHWFGILFDHEIDATVYPSEIGSAHGAPGAGQSWEIDEPGYFNGDIFQNLENGALDNGVGTSVFGNTSFPDDVSLALGWSFTGASVITITATESAPGSGFYLQQHNTQLGNDIYLYGNLRPIDGGPSVPEGGATLATLLLGLAGLAGLKSQWRHR